ncbi:hypothetical protein B6D52_00775 [Candidatus Parcubacteria bacterium 4484_255]|nr:MAG: hypothetical protein B6D52_00775 [Candidatus Parcubacteria bacterium 4484_255]
MKNKQNRKKGFTLIELLVVVAIMGMLAALAVVALNNARQRARDARRVSDIKQIQTALELYFLDSDMYPVANTATLIGGKCLDDTGFVDNCGNGTVYMTTVPTNPRPYQDHDECTGNYTDYFYSRNSAQSYSLNYCVGGDIGDVGAGSHVATPAGIVND